MNFTPLISVLIPAYNVANTIERCLESILPQKLDPYEVIVIDDGSIDDTYNILNKYKEVAQFTVIHQENHGVSYTRQRLIENANGRYILFCDADDYFELNALRAVVKAIEQKDNSIQKEIDLYVFGYNLIRSSRRKSVRCRELRTGLYTKDQYAKYHVSGLNDLYYSVLWNKCFRKDLMFSPIEITFQKLIEDVIFNIDYIGRCNTIYISDQVIYNYNQIGESLTRSNKCDSEKDIVDALDAYKALQDKALKTYPDYGITINQDIYHRLFALKKRAQAIQDNKIEAQIQMYLSACKKQLGRHYLSAKTNLMFNEIKKNIKTIIRNR